MVCETRHNCQRACEEICCFPWHFSEGSRELAVSAKRLCRKFSSKPVYNWEQTANKCGSIGCQICLYVQWNLGHGKLLKGQVQPILLKLRRNIPNAFLLSVCERCHAMRKCEKIFGKPDQTCSVSFSCRKQAMMAFR